MSNGASSTDASTFTVGGSFILGANSSVSTYGTAPLSVAGSFTLGAGSSFSDLGIMSVAGPFDPGSGNSSANDTVGGTFTAAAGSSVTTNTATWEVLAGGQLQVAAGAGFTVASGGCLLVDSGGRGPNQGSVIDQGSVTVAGALTSAPHSTIVVDYDGQLNTQGAEQFDNQGTLLVWNNPADITSTTPPSATQLNATATSNGVPLPGIFTYTPAAGALLNAGNGQILNVTFTPDDTADYSSASAQVSINVSSLPPRPRPR